MTLLPPDPIIPVCAGAAGADPDPVARFLSRDDCKALYTQLLTFLETGVLTFDLTSSWTGTTRFSSNVIRTSRDSRNDALALGRSINGAMQAVRSNQLDETSLRAVVRRLEHFVQFKNETGDERMRPRLAEKTEIDRMLTSLGYTREQAAREFGVAAILANTPEPMSEPKLFFESSYAMDPGARAAAIEPLVTPAKQAGLLAAGEIEVVANGTAFDNPETQNLYYPSTIASYSVTVRTPDGSASGWAGVNWHDWDRIDAKKLSAIALDKCLQSKNPVRIEPGRYTVILEPQAVWDLCSPVIAGLKGFIDRIVPPHKRVIDERLMISQDPVDPECPSPPFFFDWLSNQLMVYHPATWVEHGMLANKPYSRADGIRQRHQNTGLPASGCHRMQSMGGTATIDQMIASCRRAVLVTRFSDVVVQDELSLISAGYTRDGTWLIENGKISKPIKNMKFVESPLFVLNNVEQIGMPQRVLSIPKSVPSALVPALQARDFSFTALTEAI